MDVGRSRVSFDEGWRFKKGDAEGSLGALSYPKVREWVLPARAPFQRVVEARSATPAGEPAGAGPYVAPTFDDSTWRSLSIPHDWGIEGDFDQSRPGSTGKLPWEGVGWYRKHFAADAGDAGKVVSLEFDGAMAYAMVWLNGHFVGGWPYGYASFRVNLTPYLLPGKDNVVAVRLDNPPDSSRWYPGGGLYRNVWLLKTEAVHVAQWGSFVSTPRISADSALVSVALTLENTSAAAEEASVVTELFELDEAGHYAGQPVASGERVAVKVAAGAQAYLARTLVVARPKLWELDSPRRYAAVSTVAVGTRVVDRYVTPFGIRTIAFSADTGFSLNGRHVRIAGVCDHHDLGALGSAINVRALERQIEILKQMGCNAIRTSHNPPAPELLDLCDRMGVLVMDESFDCWRLQKRPNDYHLLFDDWSEADMRALVRRDRNHPSVVLWSIGNEVREQGMPEGWKVASYLAGIVREEDRTRPVTAACNNALSGYNGFQDVLDVLGYNYHGADYAAFRKSSPTIPLMGSETASTVSSRGEYYFPVGDDKAGGRADFQVSSYDLYAPRWATPPDAEFKAEDENPGVLGEFVWTGFDYLGEPTPYDSDASNLLNFTDPKEAAKMAKDLQSLGKISVPSRSSYFGIVDLAGFKKDRFYLYQARWRPDLPMAHLLPHWTWPDRVGKVTPVHVYTSGDEAELFVNGVSQGRKKRAPFEYRLRWDNVVYAPGILHVVAYRDGKVWSEDSEVTAGPAAALAVHVDRSSLASDGKDLAFVTLQVVDKDGVPVPQSGALVRFSVSGPASLAGVDSGDATSHESFASPQHRAFNGLCLAIVRSQAGAPGKILVSASSEGLSPASVELTSVSP